MIIYVWKKNQSGYYRRRNPWTRILLLNIIKNNIAFEANTMHYGYAELCSYVEEKRVICLRQWCQIKTIITTMTMQQQPQGQQQQQQQQQEQPQGQGQR